MPPRSYLWEQPQVTCPGWIVLWSHWSPGGLGWVRRCCSPSQNPPCCQSLRLAFPLNPGLTGSRFLHFPKGRAVVSLGRGRENKQIKIKPAEWDLNYVGALSELPRPLRITAERLKVESVWLSPSTWTDQAAQVPNSWGLHWLLNKPCK